MHNRNSEEELANRVQSSSRVPENSPKHEPDECCGNRLDQKKRIVSQIPSSDLRLLENTDRQQFCGRCVATAEVDKGRQRVYGHADQSMSDDDHEQHVCHKSEIEVSTHHHCGSCPSSSSSNSETRTSKNSNDLKRAATTELHPPLSSCQLDNCGDFRDFHPSGVIPTKYQVLCGDQGAVEFSSGACDRLNPTTKPVGQRRCHCSRRQERADEEGFQCKFNMMNGNLHLQASDARPAIAMDTIDSNAPCETTQQQQNQQHCSHPPHTMHHHHHLLPHVLSGKTTADKNVLNEQQQMLEQLNGMSINERRFGGFATKNGTVTLMPRITLTSADDDAHRCEDMMVDYDSGPLSPNYLAVPKLQEVGKERRPPVMVKSI